MKTLLSIICASLCCSVCFADQQAITLDVTKAPIKSVLQILTKEASVPVIADDTVTENTGAISLHAVSLETVLDEVVKGHPGMAWQKVYLAKGAAMPDPNTLAAQVRSIKAISLSNITVLSPASHQVIAYTTSAADTAPASTDQQTIYLLTNETVWAQRQAAKAQTAKANAANGSTHVDAAVSGLQSSADQLAAMSPDEQRQALPLMFQQFQQMMQNIDPQVMSDLRNQMRQNRANGNGQVPGQ